MESHECRWSKSNRRPPWSVFPRVRDTKIFPESFPEECGEIWRLWDKFSAIQQLSAHAPPRRFYRRSRPEQTPPPNHHAILPIPDRMDC